MKVVKQWVMMMGRIQSFMLILGRVGLGHFSCGLGWVWSRKLDPRPTLNCTTLNNDCVYSYREAQISKCAKEAAVTKSVDYVPGMLTRPHSCKTKTMTFKAKA